MRSWSEKVRFWFSSKIKPRLCAEWVVLSEELSILESCCFRPIMRNSVLEEKRVRRYADIHEEICFRAVWRWATLESKLRGWNQKKSPVSSAWRWWLRESEAMRVLSGVLYMTKSRGPRTETWGTSQKEICSERNLYHIYHGKSGMLGRI